LQKTIPENEKLREGRKQNYTEEKRKYQAGIKHEKLNSWKEFCDMTASTNPWSQVYKLASRKIPPKSIMTTLTKPDASEATSIQETLEVLLDYFVYTSTTTKQEKNIQASQNKLELK
jgi:hypothetical protein